MTAPFLPGISICLIQHLVAVRFKVPVAAMTSASRKREHVRPRQVAMSLAIEFTSKPKAMIGRHFGGRDHSTVCHAMRKVEEVAADDAEFSSDRAALRTMLDHLKPREAVDCGEANAPNLKGTTP